MEDQQVYPIGKKITIKDKMGQKIDGGLKVRCSYLISDKTPIVHVEFTSRGLKFDLEANDKSAILILDFSDSYENYPIYSVYDNFSNVMVTNLRSTISNYLYLGLNDSRSILLNCQLYKDLEFGEINEGSYIHESNRINSIKELYTEEKINLGVLSEAWQTCKNDLQKDKLSEFLGIDRQILEKMARVGSVMEMI